MTISHISVAWPTPQTRNTMTSLCTLTLFVAWSSPGCLPALLKPYNHCLRVAIRIIRSYGFTAYHSDEPPLIIFSVLSHLDSATRTSLTSPSTHSGEARHTTWYHGTTIAAEKLHNHSSIERQTSKPGYWKLREFECATSIAAEPEHHTGREGRLCAQAAGGQGQADTYTMAQGRQ